MIQRILDFLDGDRGLQTVGMAAAVVLITSIASLGANGPQTVDEVASPSIVPGIELPDVTLPPDASATPGPTRAGGAPTVVAPTHAPDLVAPTVDFGLRTQGVSDKEVKVGFSYNRGGCGDSADVESLLGPAVLGDPEKSIMTFARHINDTGGIGGRTYRAMLFDDGGGGCPERAVSAAVAMAEEEKVFLAVPGLHVESDYIINKKVPVWGGRDDPASLAKYGPNGLQLFEPMEPTLRTWAEFGKYKLGTHSSNNPPCLLRLESGASGDWDTPQKILTDKLRALGIEFVDVIVFKDDVSTAQAQATAAAVRLRDKGCKQAWFMAANPLGLVFVTYAAQANNWHPIWTWTGATALIDSELAGKLMEPAQWERSIGLTYTVPPGKHPKDKNCKKIYESYHPDDGLGDSAAVLLACSTVLPTAEAMRRGLKRTGRLDANSLLIGADSIRNDFAFDSTVPLSFSFPDADGPFKTRAWSHWTVGDWNSQTKKFDFPAYPCYYQSFGPNNAGCENLTQLFK